MAGQTFYAHGKLLLSAEYFVLDGALALAVPTRYGQSLEVQPDAGHPGLLSWQSLDHEGNSWFSALIETAGPLRIRSASDEGVAGVLLQLLAALQTGAPDLLTPDRGLQITTRLEFPRHWGLGSSSTLVANLARWSQTDPYFLLEKSLGGSGYDLACAQAQGPILYERRPEGGAFVHCPFLPDFHRQLYFVYLGQKQNSRTGIHRYRDAVKRTRPPLHRISTLTLDLLTAPDLQAFASALEAHETVVSELIGLPKVKDERFPDFWGSVKSLGAWGGDFVLVASDRGEAPTRHYFREKGLTVCLPFREMTLG